MKAHDTIFLCPTGKPYYGCGGSGLNVRHPKLYDTPAGQYGKDMVCPVCKGSGYDPRRHPERVKEFLEVFG